MFIEKINNDIETKLVKTLHYKKERMYRENIVRALYKAEGKELHSVYIVDKGHINGKEIHKIYMNGIIEVYNYRTRIHITTMVGRVGQLKKYIDKLPPTMYNYSIEHVARGLNR